MTLLLVLHRMEVCILTATEQGEQQTFRLADGEVATFGRSSSCAFRVTDAKVSRQHCLLGYRSGTLEVSDLGSSNDLKHRGERKAHFTLQLGDGFHAGRTYVAFVGVESAVPRAPAEAVPAALAPMPVEIASLPVDGTQSAQVAEIETLACAPLRDEPHADEPAIGAVIGNYQLVAVLGRSDRGTAFCAEHSQLHRRVAIKWLRKDADGEAMASAFLADMRKAAVVSSPYLLSVYDIEPEGPARYAAMEIAAGRSVASYLQSGPRLSWEEATTAIADVLRALSTLHEAQQVHGGVKPENVFVLDRGGAKLSDVRAEPRLRPDEWAACAAPEMSRRGVASVRADLYSVGAVAFAAITGGLSMLDGRGGRIDASKILANDTSLPPSLIEWICSMVDEDPVYRPVSAEAALTALTTISGSASASHSKIAAATPSLSTGVPQPRFVQQAAPREAQRQPPPRTGGQQQRPKASPAKVFFARLTGEMIVFTIILACGIALLLLLKIKFPDFDIYRLIGRDK